MRAFRKDFIREITKNKGRFLSVFFIVLLGAAFFSGIRSAEGDMKVSADRYYDEENKTIDKTFIGLYGSRLSNNEEYHALINAGLL